MSAQTYEHFRDAARLAFEERRLGFFHGMTECVYRMPPAPGRPDNCGCAIGVGMTEEQHAAARRDRLNGSAVGTLVRLEVIALAGGAEALNAAETLQTDHDALCGPRLVGESLVRFLRLIYPDATDAEWKAMADEALPLIEASYGAAP